MRTPAAKASVVGQTHLVGGINIDVITTHAHGNLDIGLEC